MILLTMMICHFPESQRRWEMQENFAYTKARAHYQIEIIFPKSGIREPKIELHLLFP